MPRYTWAVLASTARWAPCAPLQQDAWGDLAPPVLPPSPFWRQALPCLAAHVWWGLRQVCRGPGSLPSAQAAFTEPWHSVWTADSRATQGYSSAFLMHFLLNILRSAKMIACPGGLRLQFPLTGGVRGGSTLRGFCVICVSGHNLPCGFSVAPDSRRACSLQPLHVRRGAAPHQQLAGGGLLPAA